MIGTVRSIPQQVINGMVGVVVGLTLILLAGSVADSAKVDRGPIGKVDINLTQPAHMLLIVAICLTAMAVALIYIAKWMYKSTLALAAFLASIWFLFSETIDINPNLHPLMFGTLCFMVSGAISSAITHGNTIIFTRVPKNISNLGTGNAKISKDSMPHWDDYDL